MKLLTLNLFKQLKRAPELKLSNTKKMQSARILSYCLTTTVNLLPKPLYLWHLFFPRSKFILASINLSSYSQLTIFHGINFCLHESTFLYMCSQLISMISTRVPVVNAHMKLSTYFNIRHMTGAGKIGLTSAKSILLMDSYITASYTHELPFHTDKVASQLHGQVCLDQVTCDLSFI